MQSTTIPSSQSVSRPFLGLALGAVLCGGLGAAPAAVAETPATSFLHACHVLAAPAETAAALATAQQGPQPYLGRVFEVAATVTGLMATNGQETVMLTVTPQLTVTARVPGSLAGSAWLDDTGSRLRTLIKVDMTGNDQSLSSLSLVAAAPEADVESAEQAEAARAREAQTRAQATQTRRTETLASRSLAYRRAGYDRAASANSVNPGQPDAPLSEAALRVYPAYRDAIHRLNTRLSDSLLDTITTNLLRFSDQYGVDPRLVVAMMIAESGFDIYSTSSTGAMGLGQLMPETARGLGVTNAYDPAQNIEASIRLLRGHLDQYGGEISLTMAAYNAGPGAVRKYHGVPPYRETQHYVAKVESLYRQLCGA